MRKILLSILGLLLIASLRFGFAQNPNIPANQVDVVIKPAVFFDPNSGAFNYSYGIFSKRDSVQNVTTFGLEFLDQNAKPFAGKEVPEHWLGPYVVALLRGGPNKIAPANVAGWNAVGENDDIRPGQSIEGLGFSSYGLPGIVRSWTSGYVPLPPPVEDVSPDMKLPDPYSSFENVILKTVGADIVPDKLTAQNLIDRLISLEYQTFQLKWIDNFMAFMRLRGHLKAAKTMIQRGNIRTASFLLHAFIHEVEAQHKKNDMDKYKHIDDNGFYLLKPNAQYILFRLTRQFGPLNEKHKTR